MLKATVNVVASLVCLQLGLLHATAAPPDLVYRQEAARRFVDVNDAMGAHQPAQLDEEPVRVAQCCGTISLIWRTS